MRCPNKEHWVSTLEWPNPILPSQPIHSRESFGDFEMHTKDACSRLLKQMGYIDHGLGKYNQGIKNPIQIVDEQIEPGQS